MTKNHEHRSTAAVGLGRGGGHQGTAPSSSKKPPVGPSEPIVAMGTRDLRALGLGPGDRVREVLREVGRARAGRDGVHEDVIGSQRLRVLDGERVQRVLGRG